MKERVTMTTSGPYEMSSPSPKFFRALVHAASFQMSHVQAHSVYQGRS